jgi:hypothetical protein
MKHENRTFRGERVELDGGEFHDCRFEDCTIVFTGEGEFPVLVNPKFVDSRFALEGPAGRTAEYLRLLWMAGGGKIIAGWLPELWEAPSQAQPVSDSQRSSTPST